MGINLRRVGEAVLTPGQVQAVHLATGAVDLTSAVVTGELPNDKLAPIADVAKIQDNLLTLAKMQDDVKLVSYVGGEQEQSATGVTYIELLQTGLSKTAQSNPSKIRVVASLRVSSAGDTGSLGLFIDAETSPRDVLVSTSDVYELVNSEVNIAALGHGRHTIRLKAKGSSATSVVWNDYVDIFLVK